MMRLASSGSQQQYLSLPGRILFPAPEWLLVNGVEVVGDRRLAWCTPVVDVALGRNLIA